MVWSCHQDGVYGSCSKGLALGNSYYFNVFFHRLVVFSPIYNDMGPMDGIESDLEVFDVPLLW